MECIICQEYQKSLTEAGVDFYILKRICNYLLTIGYLFLFTFDTGHCGKTMAIIKRITNTPKLSVVKWILIADDDTIINMDRLRLLLACYNHEQPVVLGERYGYAIVSGGGYDYITGGGG